MDIRDTDDIKEQSAVGSSARDDADSFWNISELMPRRRVHGSPAPRMHTEAVEVELPAAGGAGQAHRQTDAAAGGGVVRIPPQDRLEVPTHTSGISGYQKKKEDGGQVELVYEPQGGLLHRVTVMRWQTGYSYYEQFLRNAKRFEGAASPAVPHVPFFSYMPQYSQLDSAQLAFYLFWRGEVRADRAPAADYSYILLYIYELINLYSGSPRAAEALDRLCFLWRSYREEYPRMDVQLAEWVRDMCLINQLPAPTEKLEGIPAAECVGRDLLREFYIDGSSGGIESALISYCSNYDWRRSRYAAGDALPLYKEHMAEAGKAALRAMGGEGGSLPGMRDSCIIRDAYVGALCAPCAKRRMKIEYCSFTGSYEMRFLITDIVKYSENKLRAAIGIKSRLSYGPLPTEARAAVDEYFRMAFPPAERRRPQGKVEPPPEYERLYDPLPENSTLSIENAARIEAESWGTTDRLLDAFDSANDEIPAASAAVESPTDVADDIDTNTEIETETETETDNTFAVNTVQAENADGVDGAETSELAAALGELCEFVLYAADGDGAAERRISARMGLMPSVIADRINDIAAESFGDIILEERDGAWCVILDYLDEVREALSSAEKDSDENG